MPRSYLLWLAEVDAVASEAERLAHSESARREAGALALELRVARARAERETIPRKAFRFTPSEALGEIAWRAVLNARERAVQRRNVARLRVPDFDT
jgi:hypothetical protein